MATSTPIEFSFSELQQAGLLDSIHVHGLATEVSSPPPPPRSPPSAFRDHRSLSGDGQWPTSVPPGRIAQEQVDLSRHATGSGQLQQHLDSAVWAGSPHDPHEQQADARNARTDSGRNQANNREHQRRFRARQKVCWHAIVCPGVTDFKQIDVTYRCWQLRGCVNVQAKAQAVEAQLLKTTAELQQAKARQQQLELLLQQATISGGTAVIPKVVKVHKLFQMQCCRLALSCHGVFAFASELCMHRSTHNHVGMKWLLQSAHKSQCADCLLTPPAVH